MPTKTKAKTPKLLPKHTFWRDARPRWIAPEKLRKDGWRGGDLKDHGGAWLGLEATIAEGARINAAVEAWKNRQEIPRDLARFAPASAIIEGKPIPANSGPAPVLGERTIGALVDEFFEVHDKKGKPLAPATRRYYRTNLATFLQAVADQMEITVEELRAQDIAALRVPDPDSGKRSRVELTFTAMRKAGVGPHVIRAVHTSASIWFTWVMRTRYLLTANPCKLIPRGTPEPRVLLWEDHEIAALVAAAEKEGVPSIGDAVIIALDLGCNPQDVLGLQWSQIDAQFRAKLTRKKTGVKGLPRLLDARARVVQIAKRWEGRERPANVVIYEPAPGAPYRDEPGAWGDSHFRQTFSRIRAVASAELVKAGYDDIEHKRFQDLRDTGITNMARAGCTVPEICSRALLSLESADAILKHYLGADQAFADAVSDKIDAYLNKQRQAHHTKAA